MITIDIDPPLLYQKVFLNDTECDVFINRQSTQWFFWRSARNNDFWHPPFYSIYSYDSWQNKIWMNSRIWDKNTSNSKRYYLPFSNSDNPSVNLKAYKWTSCHNCSMRIVHASSHRLKITSRIVTQKGCSLPNSSWFGNVLKFFYSLEFVQFEEHLFYDFLILAITSSNNDKVIEYKCLQLFNKRLFTRYDM